MSIWIWLVLLAGVVALAFGVYRFVQARTPKDEPYFRFLCPGCGRKLHYRARKAGQRGICPRCKQQCDYPKIPTNQ